MIKFYFYIYKFIKFFDIFWINNKIYFFSNLSKKKLISSNYYHKKYINNYFYILQSKTNLYSKHNNFFWISKYLSFFLKRITSVTIHWQLINLKLANNKILLIKLWRLTYKKRFLKFFFCSGWFYFFILLQLFFFKNIEHFCSFFKKIIQKQPIKFHKVFFQQINLIFKKYFLLLFKKKKLYGYRIYFKGKLGRKGSVKKSTLYFSEGRISYTNKLLKYNYKYFLIPTETGVIGCYIGIFY